MNRLIQHEQDQRPQAVQQAEVGVDAWRAAVRHQLNAVPDHTDFYALGADLVATLHALQDLARTLDSQVQHYGQHHPVYDDTRTADPQQRLTAAAVELEALAEVLGTAIWSADRYWSAIGHIGVEVTR
jgi:hypothetical protein